MKNYKNWWVVNATHRSDVGHHTYGPDFYTSNEAHEIFATKEELIDWFSDEYGKFLKQDEFEIKLSCLQSKGGFIEGEDWFCPALEIHLIGLLTNGTRISRKSTNRILRKILNKITYIS